MRKKYLVFSIILLLIFFSCTIAQRGSDENVSDNSNTTNEGNYLKAAEEFINSLPETNLESENIESIDGLQKSSNSSGEEIYEMPLENAGIREKIYAEANNAYLTGDTEKFLAFLKDEGIYDDFNNILNKYNLNNVITQMQTNQYSKSTMSNLSKVSSSTKQYRRDLLEKSAVTGDVILCRTGDGGIIESLISVYSYPWTHAGIIDKTNIWRDNDELCILSISTETEEATSIFNIRLGYERISSYLNKEMMSLWRVRNRENMDQKARAALVYGHQFIGNNNYNVFTSRFNNDVWYCSKVVFRCWYSQGIDLDTPSIKTINLFGTQITTRDEFVTPTDLADDNDTYRINQVKIPKPPIADAGSDMPNIIDNDNNGVESLLLDGSQSYDPDGTIVKWEWIITGVSYEGESINTDLPVGTHVITLRVTDNEGLIGEDTVSVTVVKPTVNIPPTADAGTDKGILYDADADGYETVRFDGSKSYDKDGFIVRWIWQADGKIYNGKIVDIKLPIGAHTVSLTVIDEDGLKSIDTVNVAVRVDAVRTVRYLRRYGALGGVGGTAYSQPLMKKSSSEFRRLYRIIFRYGNYIDSMRLTWVNEKNEYFHSSKIGGSGGKVTRAVYFAPDEYIYKVKVWYGWYVDKMTIYTNKKVVTVGGNPWWASTKVYDFGNGECHGFYGKAGTLVDSIGFFVYDKSIVGR